MSAGGGGGGGSGGGGELYQLEKYNWLYHAHYVRCEFDLCSQQMERLSLGAASSGALSEYAIYIRGLVKLRQDDLKGALDAFGSLKSSNNGVYLKAIARCLLLQGRHAHVVDLARETALKVMPNDWQLW